MGAPDKLLRHLQNAPGFGLLRAESHNQMGAIIADAGLQAAITYEDVVKKRVLEIKANGSAETTSGFLDLLRQKGPEAVLAWRGGRKVKLVGAKPSNEPSRASTKGFMEWRGLRSKISPPPAPV